MGLLAVLYIVFCEVKRLKFIMTVCGSDCLKGRDFSDQTGSRTHHVVTVSCFLAA